MKKVSSLFIVFICLFSILLCSCTSKTTKFLRGTADPINEMGENNDMYLNITEGNLFNKINGSWYKVGNITGPKGDNGNIGKDGVFVDNCQIVNGKLEFILSNGEKIKTSGVDGNTTYNFIISEGEIKVVTSKEFKNLDSIAVNGISFRNLFGSNLIKTGNFFENDHFSGWNTSNGTTLTDQVNYSTDPSSLNISGNKDYQNVKSLILKEEASIYVASQVKITSYLTGCAGAFLRIGGTDYLDGLIDYATDSFVTASQIVNTNSNGIDVVMGSAGSASLNGYVDSLVVLNLNKVFGGNEIPSKEVLDDLYQVYIEMFNGKQNVHLNKVYESNAAPKEIRKDVAKDKFFDLVYKKAQQLNLTLKREDITSAIGLNNGEITLEDLCKIGIAATGYEELQKIWSMADYETITGGNVRYFHVMNVNHHHAYFNEFSDYYTYLGGKPGALNHKDEPPVRTMIIEAEGPDDSTIVLVTSGHYQDLPGSNRMSNCKVVMDIAFRKYYDRNADVSDLEKNFSNELDGAIAVVLPKSGHIFNYARYDWFGDNSKYELYNFNGKMPIKTASAWKTMTAITSLDYVHDLDTQFLVRLDDLPRPSLINDPKLEGGEIVTYRDCLYFMMLPSSNIAPNVIARNVGEMMIRKGL